MKILHGFINYVDKLEIFFGLDFYGFRCYPGEDKGHRSPCIV